MTWRVDGDHHGDESSKIRWEAIPYTAGRTLDIGCGPYKVLPTVIGVDNGTQWGSHGIDVKSSASDLSLFADGSCDCVYSSHLLEHIYPDDVPATLQEWARVVKKGGYIVLYLPDEDEYPKVGDKYANKDHKWNVNYDQVVAYMDTVKRDWDLIDFQKRNQNDEYSLYFVFQLQ